MNRKSRAGRDPDLNADIHSTKRAASPRRKKESSRPKRLRSQAPTLSPDQLLEPSYHVSTRTPRPNALRTAFDRSGTLYPSPDEGHFHQPTQDLPEFSPSAGCFQLFTPPDGVTLGPHSLLSPPLIPLQASSAPENLVGPRDIPTPSHSRRFLRHISGITAPVSGSSVRRDLSGGSLDTPDLSLGCPSPVSFLDMVDRFKQQTPQPAHSGMIPQDNLEDFVSDYPTSPEELFNFEHDL